MSERPWHTRPSEVMPPRLSWRENMTLALGLAALIVGIRIYRRIFGGGVL